MFSLLSPALIPCIYMKCHRHRLTVGEVIIEYILFLNNELSIDLILIFNIIFTPLFHFFTNIKMLAHGGILHTLYTWCSWYI